MAAEGEDARAAEGGRGGGFGVSGLRGFVDGGGEWGEVVDLEGGDGGVVRAYTNVGDYGVAEGDVIVRDGTEGSFHCINMS